MRTLCPPFFYRYLLAEADSASAALHFEAMADNDYRPAARAFILKYHYHPQADASCFGWPIMLREKIEGRNKP